MSRLWWQMPGPARFVAHLADELRDGKNLVVCLPEHAPIGLASAVHDELGSDFSSAWHHLSASDMTDSPAIGLCMLFGIGPAPGSVWNANLLANDPAFTSKVVWLEGITAEQWPGWKAFLADYEQACRKRQILERTVFCIPLVGRAALEPPQDDVCLAVAHWLGSVDSLDILLYTSAVFTNWKLTPTQRQVAIAVIAGLALWDPSVSDYLTQESLGTILEPLPALETLAAARGWLPEVELAWWNGSANPSGNKQQTHSAILALRHDQRLLNQRIWAAEISVMLPFVEERRHELLTQYQHLLRVPFRTRFGETIYDAWELEIGHIEAQLLGNNVNEVRESDRHLIRKLRQIRNALAHQEVLTLEQLTSDAIKAYQ